MNPISRIFHARDKRLPDYGRAYFGHVLASWRTLENCPNPPEYIKDAVDRYLEGRAVTWGDLYLLEKRVLSIQPPASLKRRARVLRSEYLDMVGAVEYQRYLQSHPPDENDANCDINLLRADLDQILDSLHWSYSLIPLRERYRTNIVAHIGLGVVVFAIIDLSMVFKGTFHYEALSVTLFLALLFGAIGGFISLQQRAQNVPCTCDPLIDIFELQNGRFSVWQAPISGAIFALILFFLFEGGFVSGSLFPQQLHGFRSAEGLQFASAISGANYARLLVWSFIAGFAERFVPDILDRLVTKGKAGGVPAQLQMSSIIRIPPILPTAADIAKAAKPEIPPTPKTQPIPQIPQILPGSLSAAGQVDPK